MSIPIELAVPNMTPPYTSTFAYVVKQLMHHGDCALRRKDYFGQTSRIAFANVEMLWWEETANYITMTTTEYKDMVFTEINPTSTTTTTILIYNRLCDPNFYYTLGPYTVLPHEIPITTPTPTSQPHTSSLPTPKPDYASHCGSDSDVKLKFEQISTRQIVSSLLQPWLRWSALSCRFRTSW